MQPASNMKYKSILLTAALIAVSSLACHAASGLDARAAIPPDPPCLAGQASNDVAPFVIDIAPGCDMQWVQFELSAPELITPGCYAVFERLPEMVPSQSASYSHVLPITDHGWYRVGVHRPKCDWRLHSAWHPSGRSL